MMSNKRVYDAVCSMVYRAHLLLKWSEQVASDNSEAAGQLQSSVSSLLKVLGVQCMCVCVVTYLAFLKRGPFETQTALFTLVCVQ